MKTLLIFGHGYVAKHLAKRLHSDQIKVFITTRQSIDQQPDYATLINFYSQEVSDLIKSSDFILSTAAPQTTDPILQQHQLALKQFQGTWMGYLSSTGVYGDHEGRWVDENSETNPSHEMGMMRLNAEKAWLRLYHEHLIPLHIFRLTGIYGPGRNAVEAILNGRDYTIYKKNHFFSRIHVDDICQALMHSMRQPTPGEIFNVGDDHPEAANVVYQHAAKLLNREKLKELSLQNFKHQSKLLNFYQDNKKVSCQKIKTTLHLEWTFPSYIEGLQNCFNRTIS